ncbi:RnfH family protein [Lonsdalea britannica]|uniref:RnfH family protein n=1 Tax=Lonsdalea britannica TaxID=1082704 RepID=UPI0026F08919|nr:RnfH family protein [Lonsdalea britannica]
MTEMRVEVVYALPERQFLRALKLEEGSTVKQAINASGLLTLRPEIDLTSNKVGIFSRPAKLDEALQEGDRVEIYRPITADPKELRRQRAEHAKSKR